jgi:hypothetical protein
MNMLDDSSIWDGLDGDSLLKQSEKELAAVPGCAPVEAKRELVQVEVQMRRAHGPLMGPE